MQFSKRRNNILNVSLLVILSFSLFSVFLFPQSNTPSVNLSLIGEANSDLIFFEDIDLDLVSQNSESFQSKDANWNRVIPNFDGNANGLSDQFEIKILASKESVGEGSSVIQEGVEVISNNNEESVNQITSNKISVIIQFPEPYDYSAEVSLFEEHGGTVKSTYKDILNGFVGEINEDNFEPFYEQLQSYNIPFLIEENGVVESNLYSASRNMGLRPYTWNTLGYTGDDESSIAVLDTGIDDSHDFFNYTDGDFDYKIVGWQDFVNDINGNPYDDGAHGSHCAGIAAGDGDINLDGSGRTVATVVPDLDFTGEGLYDGWGFGMRPIEFNVTHATTGNIRIECNFTDYTATTDEMHGYIALYRGDTEVNYTYSLSTNWERTIVHEVTPATVGTYSLEVIVVADDNNGDGVVLNPLSRFRAKIHWDYNPPLYGCGKPWKGIAPKSHLVGVKILDETGEGDTLNDILPAYQWVYNNRETYNITVASLSYGGSSLAAEITAVNNLVEKGGIVVVAAAGNDGTGANYIGSPGDADNAITVAAMNYNDQITSYSSQGGTGVRSNTTKPDITAPGGSHYGYPMLSADTDNNTAEGLYPTDDYDDDLSPMQGTSMATPAVAGAASLLIAAMGGGNSWDWDSGADAKLVKALLLMTATETYPLRREDDASHSPALNRGGKDVHEGYGRINVDAAIEAWTKEFLIADNSVEDIVIQLNTSSYNPAGKHAYARYVDLDVGQWYAFNLTVPAGADYDIYLYNSTPSEWGEPDLIAWSTSSARGGYEVLNYTAETTDQYFLVIKAIGIYSPAGAAEEEDDDDSKSTTETMDILDFLMSPLGMLIIICSVSAVIATVCISKLSGGGGSRGSKTSKSEQDRIDSIIGGHDY